MAANQTENLVQCYYDCWRDGPAVFDEERLISILAPNLLLEGPIAGNVRGRERFIKGLGQLVGSLNGFDAIQQMYDGDEAAALYDCRVGPTAGTIRFAEFFRVKNGLIQEIRLAYDTEAYKKLTAIP